MFADDALQSSRSRLVGSPFFESWRFLCAPLVCPQLLLMTLLLLLPDADLAQRWSTMGAGRAWNESRRVTETHPLHQPTRSNRLTRSESILLHCDSATRKASNAETITVDAVAKHSPRRTNGTTIPPRSNDDAIELDCLP